MLPIIPAPSTASARVGLKDRVARHAVACHAAPELEQRLLLDLAHAFTREPELQRKFFQRLRLVAVQTESRQQHLAFAR